MIAKCKGIITKEEIIEMEAYLLQAFNFNISIDSTPYTYIDKILGSAHRDRLEDC